MASIHQWIIKEPLAQVSEQTDDVLGLSKWPEVVQEVVGVEAVDERHKYQLEDVDDEEELRVLVFE